MRHDCNALRYERDALRGQLEVLTSEATAALSELNTAPLAQLEKLAPHLQEQRVVTTSGEIVDFMPQPPTEGKTALQPMRFMCMRTCK